MEFVVAMAYGVAFTLTVFALVAGVRSARVGPLVGAVVFALVVAAPPWLFPFGGAAGTELSWTIVQSFILGLVGLVLGFLSLSRARQVGRRGG